jgi:hypothetical protein
MAAMDVTLFQGSLACHLYSFNAWLKDWNSPTPNYFFFFFCGIEMLGALKMKQFLEE